MNPVTHEELRIFLILAKTLNFKRTAENLHLPHSSISKYISQLEMKLGVKLFQRTTRNVNLSDEGERLVPLAENWQENMNDIESFFANKGPPQGRLKVTASHSLGNALLAGLLVKFHKVYPGIKVELVLSDSVLNLVEENIDVAVRIMNLESSSSLVTRHLLSNPVVACASPQYLSAKGMPKKLQDLESHPLFALELHQKLLFRKSGKRLKDYMKSPVGSWIHCESGEFLIQMALRGQGILFRSLWHVEEYIQKGILKVISLPDSLESKSEIYAVFHSRKNLPTRARVFIDFMSEECGKISISNSISN